MNRFFPCRTAAALVLVASLTLLVQASLPAATNSPRDIDPALGGEAAEAIRNLVAKHGPGEKERIQKGVEQVRRYWRPEDGDAAGFREFVENEFIPRGETLDLTFGRFETAMESLGGYHTSMVRDLRRGVDLEIGPLLPLDRRLGAYDPSAHLSEDLFSNKIAFVGLLNFPLSSLEERLQDGDRWTRRQWAETRLAHQFSTRIPASVRQRIAMARSVANSYIASYNIYTHHLLTPDGNRLFPEGQRLISHWNLRDELKARYAEPDGLAAQRVIQQVMERIVRQEIPRAVINNPLLDWTPSTNMVSASPVRDAEPPSGAAREPSTEREPDERYRVWMEVFRAGRQADPYNPENPTWIDRRFNENREIPEEKVRALFETVLSSPLASGVGDLIERRLGRPLEPLDIWYVGFKPRGKFQESELNAITRKRYPTAGAYAADIPRMLRDLGFSAERARFLADHIVVEPSRGAGHAFGAGRREDKAHLRTRVEKDGMDYKGYNIAVHEMGHNVEQVFSLTTIDHTLLEGVPNTAFTEALAFVFQARDMELLGLSAPGPEEEHLEALENFWATREIAAVALVDMAAWRWLYEHPEATPAQFREAVVGAAKEVWNRFFAPVFGTRDVVLLAIYSHMVASALYTPDYPLGHLIAFQIEEHFRELEGKFGAEFERICRLGSLTPDSWMRQAVGSPLSAGPLLEATGRALEAIRN